MKNTWGLNIAICIVYLCLAGFTTPVCSQQALDGENVDLPSMEYPDDTQEDYPLENDQPLSDADTFNGDTVESDILQEVSTEEAGALSVQHCDKAAGKVIYVLTSNGIHQGVTYLLSGAWVEFSNQSGTGHDVEILPHGIFIDNSFRLIANSKVITRAANVSTIQRGRIVVNPGPNETEHYVVVCP